MFEEAPNLEETGGTVLLRRDSLRRIFDFYREEGRMGGGKVGENFFFFFLYRDNLWLRGLLDTASRKCLRMFIGN